MTDKQIITDGVDVSECKHFKNATCIADYLLTDMNFSEAKCELCKNCYYKQLKRKEQECEKLKKYLHQNFEEKDKLHLIIDRLLEASGYDTNTASAEDFEDVYENMRCCCTRCNGDKGNMKLSEYVKHIFENREKYDYITDKRLEYLKNFAKYYEEEFYSKFVHKDSTPLKRSSNWKKRRKRQ